MYNDIVLSMGSEVEMPEPKRFFSKEKQSDQKNIPEGTDGFDRHMACTELRSQ